MPLTNFDFDIIEAEDVLKDPLNFTSTFVLSQQPILIRGLVKHDPKLQKILNRFTKSNLFEFNGNTTWDTANIAYPRYYRGDRHVKQISLRSFIESIPREEKKNNGQFIFANTFKDANGEMKRVSEEFPFENFLFLAFFVYL